MDTLDENTKDMIDILVILFVLSVGSYSLEQTINSYYKWKAYRKWKKHPREYNTSREGMVLNNETGKLEASNSFKYRDL